MRYRANRSSWPGHGVSSFLSVALIAAALLAFLAAPALAVETHPFTGTTIGPGGKAAAGQFTAPQSIAVDPSSGDLYVLDTASAGRLYKFGSNGEPLNFAATATNFIGGTGGFAANFNTLNQVAVAPPGAAGGTAGDLYVANSEALKIYSSAGVELGQISVSSNDICGVAVDSTGSIFIKSGQPNSKPIVRRYTPTTNPPTSGDISGESIAVQGTCNLGIDGKGHIYLTGTGFSEVELMELQALEAETAQHVSSNAHTVAVEPNSNDIYVSNGNEITQYTENGGAIVSKFGEGTLLEASGLSVSGTGGDVYVVNRDPVLNPFSISGRVDVFGPLVTLPKAVAGTVDSIAKTSAVVHGTINAAAGPQATCKFEYTTQAAFEAERFTGAASAPCSPGGPFTGSATEAVSAALSGLTAGTEYRFRIVGKNENGELGSNENGSAPGEVPSFETLPAFKVQTGPATNLTTTSVTLTGSINPEGVNVSECLFEYTTQAAFDAEGFTGAASAPCVPGGPFTGSTTEAVSADVSGLTAGTAYRFRLVGGSSEFGGIKVPGADAPFGTEGPPAILLQAVSGVGQASVIISGSINPHSLPTTYFVEYVTDAMFKGEGGYAKATKVPAEGVAVGSGFTPVEVSQVLSGLTPGTRYHVRFYAENTLGHAEGPDQVFTTHGANPLFGPCPANESFRVEMSALLPDCRAYELASSPDKNGDSVAGLYSVLAASEDGSAVTFYSAAGALPPAERGGTQNYSTYMAKRDASGSWSSQRLLPPEEVGGEAEFLGATPDLRYAVVEAGSVEEAGLFVVDTENGTVTQIVPKGPKKEPNEFGFDGASADGSRIFFESVAAISTTPATPAPAAGHDNLYMWERSTGDVSLVGVLPTAEGGGAPTKGSFGGAYEWYQAENPSTGGALNLPINNLSEPLAVAALHAISPSGEQVVFTSAGTGQLYLRRGLGGANPTTTYISTPNTGVGTTPGKQPAAFQEATPDGSRVFFMSRENLTADAHTGPSEEGRDLYRWDASAPVGEALTDITPDPGDPNGAEVQGLLGASSSGSSGYFIARGKLAEGAKVGEENLYRFTERANGHFKITFIAILAMGGEISPDRRNVSPRSSTTRQYGRTSRLSESGETLLFSSTRALTGYNNENLEGLSCENGLCPELFLYSAQTGKITCVSCDPTEQSPVGAASLQDQLFNAYFTPNVPPALGLSRNLSADGTKVFFQTPDSLVATDTNGDAGCPAFGGQPGKHNLLGPGRCQDVYEWEAVGNGSCTVAEANGGCLYLLSTGKSESASYFVAASRDGSSAFIATDSPLVPIDHDQAADVYDVREGGGLASQQARPPVPCTSAEACKGSGSPAPAPTSPATPSFQGPGNPKPKQCKKNYVRKNGKCVKKSKKPQKQKTKKHHHRKHRTTVKKKGGAK